MSDQAKRDAQTVVLTAPVMMTFPHLLEPSAVTRNGKATGDPKFSANFEFEPEHPDLARISGLIVKLAREKWPGRDIGADIKARAFKIPLTDGNILADKAKAKDKDREFSRGKKVLVSRSKFEPKLSWLEGGRFVDVETEAQKALIKPKLYSGVQVLAEIFFEPYNAVDEDGKDGVTAYLQRVVTLNKGERVAGGGRSAAEVFKGYAGSISAEDPTADGDPLAGLGISF